MTHPTDLQKISIILPVLNEAAGLCACLSALAQLRKQGHEVIVVDGGSRDETVALATPMADKIIQSPRGRGTQMNQGGMAAANDILLFLHADTLLPRQADRLIQAALTESRSSHHSWGRFNVRLAGRHPLLRVVERMMNWRSRLTGIATGDQAMFMRRETFIAIGGFAEILLMEDISMSKRLKQYSTPACITTAVITSSRRWEENGVWRTIVSMWCLRLAYFLGTDPDKLARRYGP